MANIGSESVKSLAALEQALGRLTGETKTLQAMLANVAAEADAIGKGLAEIGGRPIGGAGTGAAGVGAGGRGKASTMLDEEAARRKQLQQVLESGTRAETGFTSALEREIQVSAGSINMLQARGALTSEFIAAARQGQVTLGELASQAGTVAAKFGGWAIAAAGVYGLFDALKKVSQGAIETQSGVGQLSRFFAVNPAQAGAGFRQVSEQLNVPVGDVANAQAQFARLYHDQTGSLTAARTALQATKLDNLSAADSYRYLTAAAQGFQLQAAQLPQLLGMINAEQRDLGARVSDSLPAIATAAGAWRNAGGSLSDLVAITATAGRATGQWRSVGTALTRFVGRQLQMPSAQATLQSYGIDPHQDPGTIIREAQQRAQQLDRDQRQKLANALGGTKYGPRIFTPLLNQTALLSQATQSAGAPGNVKDLETEVAKVVGTSKEGIKAIGVELERLGSNLASSGLLTFGGIVLKALDEILRTTNAVLGVFDQLPGPIKSLGGELLAVYGIMRLAQRFNVGGPLGGLLGNTADRQIGTQVGIGQQNIRDALSSSQQRVTSQVYSARTRAQAAARREADYAAQIEAQGGTPTAQQGKALDALTQRRIAATERLDALVVEQEEIQAQINEASRRELVFKETTGTNLQRAQAAGYAFIPATVERGTGEPPIPIGASMLPQADSEIANQARSGQLSLIPPSAAGGEADAAVANQARGGQLSLFGSSNNDVAAAQAAEGKSFRDSLNQASESIKKVPGAAANLAGKLGDAAVGLGSSLKGIALNPLFGPLLAIQGGEALKSIFQGFGQYDNQLGAGQNPKESGLQSLLGSIPPQLTALSPLAMLVNLIGGNSPLASPTGFDASHISASTALANQADQDTWARIILGQAPGIGGPPRPALSITPQQQTAVGNLANRFLGGAGQLLQGVNPNFDKVQQGLTSGQYALPDLNKGQVQDTLQNIGDSYQKGTITLGEAQRRLKNVLTDIAHGNQSLTGKDKVDLQSQTAQVQSQIETLAAQKAPDPKSLRQILDQMGPGGQGQGGLSDWIKGNQDLIQGAADQGEALTGLGGQLAGANTALQVATSRVKGAINSGQAPNPKDVSSLKDAEAALASLFSTITAQADTAASLAKGNRGQIQGAFDRAIAQVQQSGAANTPQGQQEILALQDKKYTEMTSSLDAQTSIANALDKNPVEDAERDIKTVGQELATAIQTYGYNSKQVADLIKRQQDDYKAVAQGQVDLVKSQGAISEAQAVTPTQEAAAKLNTARSVYDRMKASGQYTPAELNVAYADVLSSQKSWAESQLQQANDLVKARGALAEASTTDPVKQARIAYQTALAERPDPHKPGDNLQILADQKKAWQDVQDKWFSQQLENIDFATKTLKESDSQAASQYLKLSKNLNLSAKDRREAYLKYFELIQGSGGDKATESELDLGKITLPTPYEVRSRLAQPGGGTRGVIMNNAPNITIYVNNSGAATRVYQALDETLGTSVESAMR